MFGLVFVDRSVPHEAELIQYVPNSIADSIFSCFSLFRFCFGDGGATMGIVTCFAPTQCVRVQFGVGYGATPTRLTYARFLRRSENGGLPSSHLGTSQEVG